MFLPRKFRHALLIVYRVGDVRQWLRNLTEDKKRELGVNDDQLRYAFRNHVFVACWQSQIEDDGDVAEQDYCAQYGREPEDVRQ
jgi:hypothetical protein